MPVLPRALEIQGEIAAIRRDIHAHPELAYEENRTSDIVAAKLQEWGLEVTRGLGRTGLVGTLRKGNSLKSIGLRADMDCLPMDETNDFEHRSQNPGRMHACGHDGHTAMLLGAAKVLSEKRDFEGAVHFIFQPAEEGGGGAARDDQGRPVREIPLRCGVRHPQQARRAARPHRHQGRPAARRGRPLGHPHHRQGRPCRAPASHHRSDGGGRQYRAGAADHRQPQHRSDRFDGRDGRLLQGRLGLQRHPGRRAYRRHDAHHDAGEPRAGEAPHRGDLPRRRADARRQDRDRAQAGLSADGEQCRARALCHRRRGRRLRRACGVRQYAAQHGRGGFLLHAGARAGRHGVAGQRRRRRRGQPAQLALRLQRHGHPVRRQLLRAHRRTLPRRAKEHGCHPERSEGSHGAASGDEILRLRSG